MSVCKICLCSDPKNDINELKSTENGELSGEFILLFCLGIQVIGGTGNSTKFCERCFSKLTDFHKFKSLALKNEAILSSLGIQKYIENDFKSEVLSQTSNGNDYDEPLIDYSELLEEAKTLDESPSRNLGGTGLEIGVALDLNTKLSSKVAIKEELPINDHPSKKKRVRRIGSIKKEKHRKIPEYTIYTNSPVKCDLCGKQLKSKYRLIMHLKTHKPIELRKPFECAHCNKTFTRKQPLETHILHIHSEQVSVNARSTVKKRLQCDMCQKSYYDRKNLRDHINAVHGGGKPQCPICNKRITEIYLQAHIKTKHQPESLPHKCETCGQKFVRESLLKRHVSIHTGAKPFSCDVCDAKFRLKYSVGLHKAQVHEKTKNHVCHICSQGYFTGSRLQLHIRKHFTPVNNVAVEKPKTLKKETVKKVECPDCGKPLASEQTMKQHRLLHKGKQNHCQICGQAFATRRYLQYHMKAHAQYRQFDCKFCDAIFVRNTTRRRHELKCEKKPPRKDTRKNRSRNEVKEEEQPNLPTVMVSVPGQPVSQFVAQGTPIFPISGPFKTEDEVELCE